MNTLFLSFSLFANVGKSFENRSSGSSSPVTTPLHREKYGAAIELSELKDVMEKKNDSVRLQDATKTDDLILETSVILNYYSHESDVSELLPKTRYTRDKNDSIKNVNVELYSKSQRLYTDNCDSVHQLFYGQMNQVRRILFSLLSPFV